MLLDRRVGFLEQDITLILLSFCSSMFGCVLGSGCYGARGPFAVLLWVLASMSTYGLQMPQGE